MYIAHDNFEQLGYFAILGQIPSLISIKVNWYWHVRRLTCNCSTVQQNTLLSRWTVLPRPAPTMTRALRPCRTLALQIAPSTIQHISSDTMTKGLTTLFTGRQHSKPHISHHRNVCLSVRLSVTRRYCVKTTQARITKSTPSDSARTLVFGKKLIQKFERVHPEWGR